MSSVVDGPHDEKLVAEGIHVHFEGVRAVDGVDLTLERGQIMGLIGPNGAGKTTFMNAVSSFVHLTAGRVLLGGLQVTNWKPERLAKSGLVRTFQAVATSWRTASRSPCAPQTRSDGTSRSSPPISRSAAPRSQKPTSMLKITDLSVNYGRVRAVQHLSLEVGEGELVGLVGHNGAGKTTTLLTITGSLKPAGGQILLQGKELVGRSPDAVLRAGVALVPEGRRIFGRLSVGENLKIGASTRRDRRQVDEDIARLVERFPVLERDWAKSGAKLSGGEQQQLAIARALVARPRLLLLDEPTLGLAPLMVDRVFEILDGLRNDGVTMLLVEQNAARTAEIANRTYVMRSGGRIEFHGTADELAQRADFETASLGMGE